jgi:hypothetical protein
MALINNLGIVYHQYCSSSANPDPRALLIFQVATEKVPLSPDRGGVNETDISVNN